MSKEKLPRGIRRRGHSAVVSFALDKGRIARRALGMVSIPFSVDQLGIFKRQVREGAYEKRQARQTIHTVTDLWDGYLLDYRNRGGKDEGGLKIAWARLKPSFAAKRGDEASTGSVKQIHRSTAGRRRAGRNN